MAITESLQTERLKELRLLFKPTTALPFHWCIRNRPPDILSLIENVIKIQEQLTYGEDRIQSNASLYFMPCITQVI